MSIVHPDLRPVVPALVSTLCSVPPLSSASLAERRLGFIVRKPPAPDIAYERRIIPGPRGNPELAVLLVNAKPGSQRPAILHTHGGGFIRGGAFEQIGDLQDIARTLDCVIVSVEYRLAPETTFSGSVEDNYAALKWLHRNAASLGVDGDRLAVLGESAGGCHAALLAIAARDRGEVPICFQCLIYPMLDDRTGSVKKVSPHVGTLVWTAADNRFGWSAFLGSAVGTARAPAKGVPARVRSVNGLPPTFIVVGGLDLFLEEDVAFAMRLCRAGVPCELHVVDGAFHGFDLFDNGLPLFDWFAHTRNDAFRRAFGITRLNCAVDDVRVERV